MDMITGMSEIYETYNFFFFFFLFFVSFEYNFSFIFISFREYSTFIIYYFMIKKKSNNNNKRYTRGKKMRTKFYFPGINIQFIKKFELLNWTKSIRPIPLALIENITHRDVIHREIKTKGTKRSDFDLPATVACGNFCCSRKVYFQRPIDFTIN